MSKKITLEEFLRRFHIAHPNEQVEVLKYSAISNPMDIKCVKCNKIKHYKNGNRAITDYSCCGSNDFSKRDMVIKWLNDSSDFSYVGEVSKKSDILVRHNKCGNVFVKNINKFFSCPTACRYCDTRRNKSFLAIEDAREKINDMFDGQIYLVEYTGRHEKCKYRCLKCGQIFSQKFDCLLGSKGCPKCDQNVSLGERRMEEILVANNIPFERQSALPINKKQHFDFAIKDCQNKIIGYIEVQGEQHYLPVVQWGGQEQFDRRVKLDNIKREWCKNNGYPLYEVKYFNKKFLNLDILPFLQGSTTISAKESTSQANGDGNGSCL